MTDYHDIAVDIGSGPVRDQDFWAWSQSAQAFFPNIQLTTPDRYAFRAGQNFIALGDVQLFDMSTSPHTVQQHEVVTGSAEQSLCKLSLQLSGVTHLTQDGRYCALEPGDLALYVAHRPYTLHYIDDQRSLIIQFPQELLHLVHQQVAQVTALPVNAHTGLGRVAVPLFEQLAINFSILQGPHAIRLVRSALEMLVTVLLEASRDNEDNQDNPLFSQAVAFIDDHLHDPQLGPQNIADYFYVSLRQLHGKFSEENQTISAYIRNERMRRIRNDLADPTHRDETVQTISSRYGLTDASHVSKLFKQTYGETPSGYRSSIFGG
ncbi:MAG: helix-turn-helix domain-containing protein [Yaniella sp.]|uniref:AraC-like ligand-binding domain-containing protein n=1 Tax=Yaniella sp. TaxID=2773929 RepID=UPI00264996C5|nr:helix-turn-helix domain-containing protein [Yaniella sp.]MDN5731442.1 helix-turn-helix domain-containing protein [Yaniella sp.]MDN5913153.1 helix-turn-helix domain-containing protein [Yaniella sp.]MDN6150210.1 helix-turn-helix domain-containing protein [Yaniella sp.]MDN6358126.1 helix-turn-helix domain-containing protein [Yaniella sp.]MDN6410270.1 helix-turn-helix domain-containing protein [Yaniella sp.]